MNVRDIVLQVIDDVRKDEALGTSEEIVASAALRALCYAQGLDYEATVVAYTEGTLE